MTPANVTATNVIDTNTRPAFHNFRPIFAASALAAFVSILASPSALAQQTPSASPSTPTIQVGTDALLIPTVVRDATGHAVGNLTQADFTVLDQGKPRPLSGFSIVNFANTSTPVTPNVPAAAAAPATPAPAPQTPLHFTVLLFDDRHLEAGDLENTKLAASRLFDQPLPAEDRYIVLSFRGVNSGVTRDPAVLKAAIAKLKTTTRTTHQECPDISYFQADLMENQHNAAAFSIAFQDAESCSSLQRGAGNDPGWQAAQERLVHQAAQRVLQIGDANARETVQFMRDVVGSMSKLPGQRTLVFLSPGYLSSSTDAMNLTSELVNVAGAFNVTINTLDVRGMSSSALAANDHGSFAGAASGANIENVRDQEKVARATMADLADSTGGTFFHNNNDLTGGLKSLVAAPEYLYLLQISLKDVKRSGTYHKLEVKVNQPGVKAHFRSGYYAPSSKK